MVNGQVGVVNNDDVGTEEEDAAEELTPTAHLIRSNATTLHANHLKCAHAVTIPYLFPLRHRRHCRRPPPPSHCLSLFPPHHQLLPFHGHIPPILHFISPWRECPHSLIG